MPCAKRSSPRLNRTPPDVEAVDLAARVLDGHPEAPPTVRVEACNQRNPRRRPAANPRERSVLLGIRQVCNQCERRIVGDRVLDILRVEPVRSFRFERILQVVEGTKNACKRLA